MELLHSRILAKGGGCKKEGEQGLFKAGRGGSTQGSTFTGAQSITGKLQKQVEEDRGRGRERVEKGERPEAGTGPGRLPRGSNLQPHLSPWILGQASLE